jgi:hypothetical protein
MVDDLKARMMFMGAKAALAKALKDGKLDNNLPLKRVLSAVDGSDEKTWEFRDISGDAARRRFEDMVVGTEIVFQDKDGGWHSVVFA